MKGLIIVNYPEFLKHNPKDIMTLIVLDFNKDCYFTYNSQNYNFNKKLKNTKNKGIKKRFDEILLKRAFLINDETFKKLLQTDLLFFKQNYCNTVLKSFNLEEFLI